MTEILRCTGFVLTMFLAVEVPTAFVRADGTTPEPVGSAVQLTTSALEETGSITVNGSDPALDALLASFGPPLSPENTTRLVLENDNIAKSLRLLDLQMNQLPSETLLVSAPISVVVIFYLTLLAAGDNFKLGKLPENRPRKYVQTDQFAEAVATIHSGAFKAFQSANKDMDTIRTTMGFVPSKVKEIQKLIEHEEPAKFNAALEATLTELRGMADKCSKAAHETSDMFRDTQNVILELKEIVIGTAGQTAAELSAAERDIQFFKIQQEGTKALLDKMNQELKYLSDLAEEQKKKYDDAIANVPTGWTAVFQDVLRTFDFSAGFNAIATVAAARYGAMGMGMGMANSMVPNGGMPGGYPGDSGSMPAVLPGGMPGGFPGGMPGGLPGYLPGGLPRRGFGKREETSFVHSAAGINPDLYKRSMAVTPRVCQAFQDVTRQAFEKLASTQRTAKDYEEFCTTHDMATRHLRETFQKGAKDSDDYDSIDAALAKSLDASSRCMTAARSARKRNAEAGFQGGQHTSGINDANEQIEAAALKEAEENPSLSSSRGGMQSTVGKQDTNRGNERWIVVQQKEVLDATRKNQQKHREEIYKTMQLLNNETANIANLTLVATDLKHIIAAADRAIRGLGMLALKWADLVAFFDSFTVLIDSGLVRGGRQYDSSVQMLIKHANADPAERLKFVNAQRNAINLEGQKLEIIALVCMHLADDVALISKNHITPQLSEIGLLQSLNPRTEPAKAKAELAKFATKAQETVAEIKKLMQKNEERMQNELDEKLKKIAEIQAVVGEPTPKEKKRIDDVKELIAEE